MNVTNFDPYFYIPCPRGSRVTIWSRLEAPWMYGFSTTRSVDIESFAQESSGATTSHERSSSRNGVLRVEGLGSIHFRNQGKSAGGDGTLSDGDPILSMEVNQGSSSEPGVGAEVIVYEAPL